MQIREKIFQRVAIFPSAFVLSCLAMHIYEVWYMCMGIWMWVSLCAHVETRGGHRVSSVFHCHSLPYFFKDGSFNTLGAHGLSKASCPGAPRLYLSLLRSAQPCPHIYVRGWDPNSGPHAYVLSAQQVLLPPEPSHQPYLCSILNIKILEWRRASLDVL